MDRGIAGIIQNLVRLVGGIVIPRNLGVVSPTLRRQDAIGGLRESAPEVFDHRTPVNRIRECLADANIAQNRIAQVERQIGQNGPGRVFDLRLRSFSSASTMSEVSALLAMSALPLRNSRARVVVSAPP